MQLGASELLSYDLESPSSRFSFSIVILSVWIFMISPKDTMDLSWNGRQIGAEILRANKLLCGQECAIIAIVIAPMEHVSVSILPIPIALTEHSVHTFLFILFWVSKVLVKLSSFFR